MAARWPEKVFQPGQLWAAGSTQRRAISTHKAHAIREYGGAGWNMAELVLHIWQLYPPGTLNAQEACTPQEGATVTCCVTSGKFHPLSGPWLSHLKTQAVRTNVFSGGFLLQDSMSGTSFYPRVDGTGAGTGCCRDRYGSSYPQHQLPWSPSIKILVKGG